MQELWHLAQYINRLNYEQIPSFVIKAARYAILDNMGAALGAAHQSEIVGYINELLQWETEPQRSASVCGPQFRPPSF
jgi:2-methylcitrate dehydratase PrpD